MTELATAQDRHQRALDLHERALALHERSLDLYDLIFPPWRWRRWWHEYRSIKRDAAKLNAEVEQLRSEM